MSITLKLTILTKVMIFSSLFKMSNRVTYISFFEIN